jgi:hypothetical protein
MFDRAKNRIIGKKVKRKPFAHCRKLASRQKIEAIPQTKNNSAKTTGDLNLNFKPFIKE